MRAGRGRETPWSGAAAGGAAEQSRAEQAARHAALAWMEPEPDASIEYDRVASIHASASALGGPRTPAHPRRAAWASITGEAVTDLSTCTNQTACVRALHDSAELSQEKRHGVAVQYATKFRATGW